MFIVSLTYIAPLADLDAAMADHIAFLEKHYATGMFVASGRKIPRTGGIILAKAESEAALRKVLEEDPFHTRKLADIEVQEFAPSKVQAGLEGLL